MKLGILKSIGHNIADSLGSDIGLMIGVYTMDVFLDKPRLPLVFFNLGALYEHGKKS